MLVCLMQHVNMNVICLLTNWDVDVVAAAAADAFSAAALPRPFRPPLPCTTPLGLPLLLFSFLSFWCVVIVSVAF